MAFHPISGKKRQGLSTKSTREEEEDKEMLSCFSCCLGQHADLQAAQDRLVIGDHLFAFLDDMYVLTTPNRVCPVHACLREELWARARIRIHSGNCFLKIRDSSVFGTPLGHAGFVESHLQHKSDEHSVLLPRIPAVPDVQSAWGLLPRGPQEERTTS